MFIYLLKMTWRHQYLSRLFGKYEATASSLALSASVKGNSACLLVSLQLNTKRVISHLFHRYLNQSEKMSNHSVTGFICDRLFPEVTICCQQTIFKNQISVIGYILNRKIEMLIGRFCYPWTELTGLLLSLFPVFILG